MDQREKNDNLKLSQKIKSKDTQFNTELAHTVRNKLKQYLAGLLC